ncbi:hypothetical protein ACFSGI_04955 [Paenibacillus nicotianae]|uniref:Transposase DDE domain-containing protein n=1 Tax=Paenibacillus nicotianae TaxID=1526551 RepID=A0ABW4UPT6_9BACL
MARTQTQKAIRKATRSGSWIPEYNRKANEDYAAISQHTRLTSTKQERLQKVKHKKHIIHDDASFLCLLVITMNAIEDRMRAKTMFSQIA